MKLVFPRSAEALQCIVVNSAGGITGGDRFELQAEAGEGTRLILTTQAAERAYRAQPGPRGRVRTCLTVAQGARLDWLPQELILFEGCALDRRLTIELDAGARLLMVEPVVFGRAAAGERLGHAAFRDRIAVNRAGHPLYRDGIRLEGDLDAAMATPATAAGMRAMASLLYVAPDAEAHLAPLRQMLPETGGASLLAPDVLALRLLAPDSHALRIHLLPALDRLTGDALPTSWRL